MEDKRSLTGKEKASYGLGAVGKNMVYMLSASYVLYYFQDICGVSAVAMGIILMAALIASIALSIFSLSNEATTKAQQTVDFSESVSAASKAGLRMTMTILPIIGLFVAFFWFRKKYILTDEKVAEIAEQLKLPTHN